MSQLSEEGLDPSILNSGETVVEDGAKSTSVDDEAKSTSVGDRAKSTSVEEGPKSTKSVGDGLKCTTPFEAEKQCNVPLFIYIYSFFFYSLYLFGGYLFTCIYSFFIAFIYSAIIYFHTFILFL